MKDFLPKGILGLAIASFFAAYMSTIDTHLNWGASYLVNDVYKRFIKPEATQKHYIMISMVFTVLLAVLGMLVTTLMQSIREGWYIITAISGGVSVIYILRWYWWRINAWSEISAMASALICTLVFRFWLHIPYPHVLYYIVPITVAVALVVTMLTPPVDDNPWQMLPAYLLSVVSVYGALFGVGKLLLGPWWLGALLLAISAASGYAVWRIIGRVNWTR